MKQTERRSLGSSVVRRLARGGLAEDRSSDLENLTPEDIRALVQELEVHRIELKAQNEELAEAQSAAESSLKLYRELYESVPVGYVTIDLEGTIQRTNLAAADLLGIARDDLVGRKLSDFVEWADQDTWYVVRRVLVAGEGERRSFGLGLIRADETTLEIQIVTSGCLLGNGHVEVALVDITELRRTERSLRTAASEVSLVEQRERQKLASELHDDAGQLLALASIRLRALGELAPPDLDAPLQDLSDLLTETRRRISSLSFQLSPPMLHDIGLRAALQWLAEDLERSYGLAVEIVKGEEIPIEEISRITLYRTARELLINAAKHSGGQRARLRLWRDDAMLHLAVEDDGVGFSSEGEKRGFGLIALQDRIEKLGGSCALGVAPSGIGAQVVASLPHQPDRNEADRRKTP
jgi:PAS domain S-box-containing protein